jgi:hypothetical protein
MLQTSIETIPNLTKSTATSGKKEKSTRKKNRSRPRRRKSVGKTNIALINNNLITEKKLHERDETTVLFGCHRKSLTLHRYWTLQAGRDNKQSVSTTLVMSSLERALQKSTDESQHQQQQSWHLRELFVFQKLKHHQHYVGMKQLLLKSSFMTLMLPSTTLVSFTKQN